MFRGDQVESNRVLSPSWRWHAGLAAMAAHGRAAMTATAQSPNSAGRRRLHAAPTDSPVLSPEDEMKTFFLPPGYRVELVASEPMIQEPVRDRLGSGRPPVGGRDARLHAGHRRHDRARAARPHQRARGHERRRQDGQEDGLPRQARAAARAEGARSRRARRRAAEPLAGARHQRRPARRHARSSSPTPTGGSRPTSSTTPTACSGRSTTGCTRPRPTSTCG